MRTVTVLPGGAAASGSSGRRRSTAVGGWLLFVAFLVFLMVVVGGVTRLTESGLSIVDWRPVTGLLPPLSEAAWQAAFDAYKASPEYRIVNQGMDIEAFKGIFWWEYIHRLLGRLVGVFYALPLVWFWARGAIPHGYKGRLFGLLLLGGLQGLMGWLMVKSGLVNEPEVSHLRLTAHLSLALVIFAALFWTALDLLPDRRRRPSPALARWGRWLLFLLGLQLILGGLVAGLKAGYIHNSWPLMEGRIIPSGLFALDPLFSNFIDNATMAQFSHRLGAYLLVLFSFLLLVKVSKDRRAVTGSRLAAVLVFLAVVLQAALGIATLLLSVPVAYGAAHQAMAVFVLASLLLFTHLHSGRTP